MEIRNFLFHRVSDEGDRLWPPMKPELFERIIRYLKRNYEVLVLEDYLNEPAHFRKSKMKFASVQFDDGYKDNIEIAAEILQRHQCPASFYVVTDCIDTNTPTWTYLLDHALQHTRKKSIELPFAFVPEDKKKLTAGQSGSLVDIGRIIKPWLKAISNQHRVEVLQSVLQQCNDNNAKQAEMMNWSDVNALQSGGFHIGSHSVTHPLLATMADEKEIGYELEASAARIAEMTGKRPVTISYPIGSFDQRVIARATACGYRYGLAVEHRFYSSTSDPVMAIPRVELYQEPYYKAFARISGLANLIRRK